VVLRVDPEELEAEAVKIEALAEQFGQSMDTEQSNVEGMNWDGDSGAAFVGLFEQARTKFRDVEEAIGSIASLLRATAADLQNADAEVARAIRGAY
jgi:WXG100 family type VII secretion target